MLFRSNALRGDEFILFAQPIVALNARPGSPGFQEILVRFQEEEQKMLPPGTFIPLLESCALMHYLDRWVASRSIRWVRTFCKLRPGDVIVTGTPGGVGAARTPPEFMKPGDVAEIEITGVGTLRNVVKEG